MILINVFHIVIVFNLKIIIRIIYATNIRIFFYTDKLFS